MINLILPLDYLYSWTESIIIKKLAPVKEYRAVVILSYAVALFSSSSFIALLSILLHHPKLDFVWFLGIVVAAMFLSYYSIKRLYFDSKRFDKLDSAVKNQSESSKKSAFWMSYLLIHLYSFFVLVAVSKVP